MTLEMFNTSIFFYKEKDLVSFHEEVLDKFTIDNTHKELIIQKF